MSLNLFHFSPKSFESQVGSFWAADPKGTMSYRTEGGISVCPSERESEGASERTNVRSSRPPRVQPPPPPRPQPLGPVQAPAPQALRDPPQAPAPFTNSRPPATPLPPGQAPSPLREPLPPMDGRKFPPLFYRTLYPFGSTALKVMKRQVGVVLR